MVSLERDRVAALEQTAKEARRWIVRAVNHATAGHLGGPLSATDIMVALYFDLMRIDPARPDWEDRDRFILSKGHSSIGLYTVLALRGFFPTEELYTFDHIDSRLQGHPDMTKTPGVDMASGSLGQGLSPALGMALGARMLGKDFHTWCILGDGEIQEGQIWEAAFVADKYKVDNLTAILDYNKLQQFGWLKSKDAGLRVPHISTTEVAEKWSAFGWHVVECDGHKMDDVLETLRAAKAHKGQPTIVIAHTIKGKGVSYMENDYNWHSKPMTQADYETAMADLGAAVTGGN
ncbi:MAG TPA: transketolase [Chloroflexota bacterium]|nr:transketolase [Chloroflexota bacterium]